MEVLLTAFGPSAQEEFYARRILCQMQGQEGNRRRLRGSDEERKESDQGEMPDMRGGDVQNSWGQGLDSGGAIRCGQAGGCGRRARATPKPKPPPEPASFVFPNMSQQLAYVIITPYSLYKSRTGGIFARLITRTGLELVAARMFAPSRELVKEYS